MASPAVKKLGQVSPSSATDTVLYTCPSGRRAVVSTCSVTETGGALATYRICSTTGSTTVVGEALAWEVPLDANSRHGYTEGWTLAAGDKIYVRASTAGVTFTLFGEESDVPA